MCFSETFSFNADNVKKVEDMLWNLGFSIFKKCYRRKCFRNGMILKEKCKERLFFHSLGAILYTLEWEVSNFRLKVLSYGFSLYKITEIFM